MKFAIQKRLSIKEILAGAALTLTVFGGAFMLTLSGCTPATDSVTTSTNVTFTQVYNDVFSQSCVTCHAPGRAGSQNGETLNFTTQASAYTTLFNRVSGTSSPGCSNYQYISANSPSTSYLIAVEVEKYNTTSGSCTPIVTHLTGAGSLSDAKSTEIINWINSGALNN